MTEDKLKLLQDRWYHENAPLGKKLGYPECCINEFCLQPPELMKINGPSPIDRIRFSAGCIKDQFTGFIPCGKHAKQILNGEITLKSLIKNRNKELFGEFPNYK